MANESKQNTEVYRTQLAKTNDVFMPMIEDQLNGNGIVMSDYQKTITLNAMTAISTLLADNGLSINQIDKNNVTHILLQVAALQLNAAADPREVYFIIRNKKNKDGSKSPQVEMGIEGDGNDALLRRFGRDVKTVHKFWAVRSEDDFEYPSHKGIETVPPTWTETGEGTYEKVVYPITMEYGETEYFITEREGVKRNLLAHVAQNLMWNTGDKKKFMDKASGMKLDEILDDPEMVKLGKISPAWSSPQSRETMILRKMRNNIVKKIPKDFSNGYLALTYSEATDPTYDNVRKDVTENANTVSIDDVKQEAIPEKIEPEQPKDIKATDTDHAEPEPTPVEVEEPVAKKTGQDPEQVALISDDVPF